MKKVSLRIEDEILEILKILCGTDNVSEAVRIAKYANKVDDVVDAVGDLTEVEENVIKYARYNPQ